MKNVAELFAQINEANHDSICAAVKDGMPSYMFDTFEYSGVTCASDGAQFVELIVPSGSLADPKNKPRIIPMPKGQVEVTTLATDLGSNLANVACLTATLGCPMSDLAVWIRLVLVKHGCNIVDRSQDLLDATKFVLEIILRMDVDQTWFVNACLHHCSEATKVPHEQVCQEYAEMSDQDALEFIQNTATLMGFAFINK